MSEQKTKREFFKEQMAMLAAAYGRDFDAIGIRAYHHVLGNLTEAQLATAFKRAMSEERFCPSPATVKAYAPPAPPAKNEDVDEANKPIKPWTREEREEAQRLFKRLLAAVTPEESKGKLR